MDAEAIRDAFAPFGTVDLRKMFGGTGIYRDKVMFALEANGELYLKAAPEDEAAFAAAGCRPFIYDGKVDPATGAATPVKLGYWTVPDAAFDDADMLREWAGRAFATARAAADRKVAMLTDLRARSTRTPDPA